MVYFSEETFESDNPDLMRIERKPWNVHEGDIILLCDNTQGLLTQYIPVEIRTIWTEPEYYRKWWENGPNNVARTQWVFHHKPLNPDDSKQMYNWWTTKWNRFDTVDFYRKATK